MGRIAGVPNKVTAEVKEKLEELTDEIVNSIDIEGLTTNQKIKMLQISCNTLYQECKHLL